MKAQGKTPKQFKDSLIFFELALWVIVITCILILIFQQ